MVTGWQLIPEGWEEHHAAVIGQAHTILCNVSEPASAPGFDTGPPATASPKLTDVPCWAFQLTDSEADSGHQLVDQEVFRVTVPKTYLGAIAKGDLITFTGAVPGHQIPPTLLGRTVIVHDLQAQSLSWEIEITCTGGDQHG